MGVDTASDVLRRKPITGITACCARAASGHAAAPPSSVMKSRRFGRIACNSPRRAGPHRPRISKWRRSVSRQRGQTFETPGGPKVAEGTSRRPLSAKQAKARQPQPGPTRWTCMTKSEQLRIRARECEALAEVVHDPELRWLYRDMAAQWRQMARQRDELGLYDRAVEDRDAA